MSIPISLRCPRCNRQISYIRVGSGEGICQTCGKIITPEEVQKQFESRENKPSSG
jgi:ribosomal protein L37AE/L43A